ncbi:hypothetical protein, partial [Actinopolyspora erythraea]|uniref:hypothetical protein n=1 Tax=Actinopolyspora erythraea TaxID=414996 RepID=UPI001C123E5F
MNAGLGGNNPFDASANAREEQRDKAAREVIPNRSSNTEDMDASMDASINVKEENEVNATTEAAP